jgi:hypothetical protein
MEYWVSNADDFLILIFDEGHVALIRTTHCSSIPLFQYPMPLDYGNPPQADWPGPEDQVFDVRIIP